MPSARVSAVDLNQTSPVAGCAELRVVGDTSLQQGPQETVLPVALIKPKHVPIENV